METFADEPGSGDKLLAPITQEEVDELFWLSIEKWALVDVVEKKIVSAIREDDPTTLILIMRKVNNSSLSENYLYRGRLMLVKAPDNKTISQQIKDKHFFSYSVAEKKKKE